MKFAVPCLALSLTAAAWARLLPVAFEPNRGQAPADVRFVAHAQGYALAFKNREVVIAAGGREVAMEFDATETIPRLEPTEPLAGISNYYVGGDASRWIRNVPRFGKIVYREIAPGIDLVFRAEGGQAEFDFVVAPGADPSRLRLRYRGAAGLRLAANGDAILDTGAGEIRQHLPVVYQGGRTLPVHYVRSGRDTLRLALADYDHGQTLVVDPKLSYWTYLGGSLADGVVDLALDSESPQNVYVLGSTASADFPKAGAGTTSKLTGSSNLFVAKFNSAGALVYSTFIGGSGSELPYAIAVDAKQNVYLTGNTTSQDFPNVPRAGLHPATGILYASLDANGALTQAISIGGGANDGGRGIALASGMVYIAGQASARLQLPFNGHEAAVSAYAGGLDAMVLAINPADFSLYLAYLGGAADDFANRIAIDKTGAIYLSGNTASADFPGPGGGRIRPAPTTTGGPFVTKFTLNLSTLAITQAYSTYLGDQQLFQFSSGPLGFAVDTAGNVWVGGATFGTGFTPTADAYQKTFGGKFDATLTKIDANGAIAYATYFGGADGDAFYALALSPDGTLIAGGISASDNLKTTADAVQSTHTPGASSGLLVRFDAKGQPLYVSYLGGTGPDSVRGAAVDLSGNVWVAGLTCSPGLNTSGAQQSRFGGGTNDGYVAEYDLGLPAIPAVTSVVNGASFQSPIQNNSFITITGVNLSKTSRSWQGPDFVNGNLPLQLDGVTVTINGKAAAVNYISPTQINALAPADAATGTVNLVVTTTAGTSQPFAAALATYSPAFFVLGVAAPGGKLYPAATFVDGSYLAPANLIPGVATREAKPGEIVNLYGTGFGPTSPAVPFPAIFSGAAGLSGTVVIQIGGQPCAVGFAGVSVNGLYQFNITVPNVPDGDQALTASIGGVTSQGNLVLSVKR